MKNLRQLCIAVVLTFMLTTPSFAGDGQMETPFAPLPPTTSSATANGQMDTGFAPADSMSVIALNLLQSVLSLF